MADDNKDTTESNDSSENNDVKSEGGEAQGQSPVSPVVDISKIDDSPEHKRETTRSKIAMFYVVAFFGIIVLSFILGFLNCFEAKDYKEMLITISGILSGPLGFIIGYYFKSATSKD